MIEQRKAGSTAMSDIASERVALSPNGSRLPNHEAVGRHIQKFFSVTAGCAVLLALVTLSIHLSLHRIFQVDEVQSVLTARLLATGKSAAYSAPASLMFFGPMRWIAGHVNSSVPMLRAERLLFLPLFWLNLCLSVACAGIRLRSSKGLWALIFVSTLAPLWDYGFEIRHDNLLLTFVLLSWLAARPLVSGRGRSLLLVGSMAMLGQVIAFKAFVYMVPIALFALYASWREEKRPLARALATLLAGCVLAFAAAASVQLIAGTWSLYSSDVKSLGSAAVHAIRLPAWPTLLRLVVETPALLVATLSSIIMALAAVRLKSLTSTDSLLPEVGFLGVALVALLANPTPFAYNLVLLVPQAAILCMRTFEVLNLTKQQWRVALILLLTAHAVTWAATMPRHLFMSNARQLKLITAAESLTDPRLHSVLDGSGLVPTRNPPGHDWLIHTFTLEAFRTGASVPIRRQLAEGRTPVVIPNYRVLALPAADLQFIRNHYIALAGDFLVTGGRLPPGMNRWECLVGGRYYLAFNPSDGRIVVDGRAATGRVVQLSRGVHTIGVEASTPVYLIWVGPTLSAPPSVGRGDALRVFVNWY